MGRTEGKALGVAVATIEHWLHTKENLAPDLLEEVKAGSRHDVPHRTFEKLATILPQQAELQKLVLEKAEKEDLTSTQVQQVAKAVKQTTNPVELRSILNRPVARTSEELTREARVENLLLREAREPTRVDSFLSPGGRGLR